MVMETAYTKNWSMSHELSGLRYGLASYAEWFRSSCKKVSYWTKRYYWVFLCTLVNGSACVRWVCMHAIAALIMNSWADLLGAFVPFLCTRVILLSFFFKKNYIHCVKFCQVVFCHFLCIYLSWFMVWSEFWHATVRKPKACSYAMHIYIFLKWHVARKNV